MDSAVEAETLVAYMKKHCAGAAQALGLPLLLFVFILLSLYSYINKQPHNYYEKIRKGNFLFIACRIRVFFLYGQKYARTG